MVGFQPPSLILMADLLVSGYRDDNVIEFLIVCFVLDYSLLG